jgi:hypothetical protein
LRTEALPPQDWCVTSHSSIFQHPYAIYIFRPTIKQGEKKNPRHLPGTRYLLNLPGIRYLLNLPGTRYLLNLPGTRYLLNHTDSQKHIELLDYRYISRERQAMDDIPNDRLWYNEMAMTVSRTGRLAILTICGSGPSSAQNRSTSETCRITPWNDLAGWLAAFALSLTHSSEASQGLLQAV